MKKLISLFLFLAVQVGLFAQENYPEGTRWMEIRLDTLKYENWYSKVGDEWVPNFETIEYYVAGEITDKYGDTYKCVYTNGPEWSDSLTFLIQECEFVGENWVKVTKQIDDYDGSNRVLFPSKVYQFDWSVGKGLYYEDILDANSTQIFPYFFYYGVIDEIKEGDFGGVRPLKYVDLDGKAPVDVHSPGNTDTNGGRIIQGIGITEWKDGECLFGPPNLYSAAWSFEQWKMMYSERYYRSMLVHFERDGEVLYDVWPRKGSTVEVAIDGLNYFLYLDKHEAVLTGGNNCSGEVDIPSEVNYNDETFVVKSMTHSAFFHCTELTKVRIPKTIESIIHYYPVDPDWLDPPTGMANPIYVNPFYGCTALESIQVDEENPSLKSVDGVLFSQDGVGKYYYNTGSYFGTGLYCYPEGARQESYTIPENVEWIGGQAFSNNQYLTTLTMPNSTKHICYYAFSGCSNLTNVYCKAESVPIAWDGAFKDVPIASATLHVPASSVEAYKATAPWSDFGNIVAIAEEPLPFLEGNPIWVYKYEHLTRAPGWKNGVLYLCFVDTGYRYFTYYFLGGQKEIDGKVYTMVGEITSRGEDELTVNRWLPVREENGIVYTITDSLPGLIEYAFNKDNIPYQQVGNECILYNFNTKIGEKFYPQIYYPTVESYGTYQLMDGTVCRVLKTIFEDSYLYEKLGFMHSGPFGIMGPPYEYVYPTGGDVYTKRLNEYFGDYVMLYKAPDVQEGLCVNDTCWSRDDAEAYVPSYKADPRQEEVFSYIRQLQTANEPVTYTTGQMATIILPTEPDASKGKYYRIDRCENGQIVFEQELHPQARTPYIIVPDEDFSIDPSTLDLEGLNSDTVSIEGISFIGSYSRMELPALTGGDGGGSSFYYEIIDSTPDCQRDEAFTIGALRAYLTVRWDDPINPGGERSPQEKMGIVLKDYETNISLTPAPSPGRGEIYDLSGRKWSMVNGSWSMPKGIYIEGGKKVVK